MGCAALYGAVSCCRCFEALRKQNTGDECAAISTRKMEDLCRADKHTPRRFTSGGEVRGSICYAVRIKWGSQYNPKEHVVIS